MRKKSSSKCVPVVYLGQVGTLKLFFFFFKSESQLAAKKPGL